MKRAFTLIEVLISVTLLTIIVLFLTSASVDLRNGYDHLFNKEKSYADRYDITRLLYYDLLQATLIDIQPAKNFDTIHLKTKNTLYENENPFVSYTVLKKGNTLLRLEDESNITLPIAQERIYTMEYLAVAKELEEFKITLPSKTIQTTDSNTTDKMIVSLFFKKKEPIVFELGLINHLEIKAKPSS